MRSIIKESSKHYIYISVKGAALNSFVVSLYQFGIETYNINYINTEEIRVKILKKDYYKIKPFLKKNVIILISLLLGVFLLYFLSRIIVRVDVIHSKKEIREIVRRELEEYGVKRLSFKKNYGDLQKIKKKILDKYPHRLEWMEIEIQGMNIKVRIEERIITDKKEEENNCHIIASKDAIITKIIAYAGETKKKVGNYVKKDDIIISGDITLNESIKSSVCAKGEIYGEVWYTVDVIVPMSYDEHIATKRVGLNFMYETSKYKKSILRSRFKHFVSNNKYIFSIWDVNFYFQKESEYKVKPRVYTESEAINRGNELALEKIKLHTSDNDTILIQKVLKKSLNNSTMNLEIFFAVNELISTTFEFVPPKDEVLE